MMFFKLQLWRERLAGKLWLRPALASLFALAMAMFAYWFGHKYEWEFGVEIDEDSLVALLSIFASSMLSVATFTVSAIVAAAASVANSTTYRASQYVLGDAKAQLVLSAFIAAFIYSIVGLLSLKAFHYGDLGRFILFLGLIVLVVFVLIAFINWVDHAMKLGRQETTLSKMTEAAIQSINPLTVNNLGARAWDGQIPSDHAVVYFSTFGYVTAVDMASLNTKAEQAKCQIILVTRPGEVAEITTPIAYISPASAADEALIKALRESVAVSSRRQITLDPRYNLINLTETADKALSPGINDPGTAINILNLQLKVLAHWIAVKRETADQAVEYQHLSMLPISADELITDSFGPVARDGAGILEVNIRLQKVLQALARMGEPEFKQAAQAMSVMALELANASLVSESQRQQLTRIANAFDQQPVVELTE